MTRPEARSSGERSEGSTTWVSEGERRSAIGAALSRLWGARTGLLPRSVMGLRGGLRNTWIAKSAKAAKRNTFSLAYLAALADLGEKIPGNAPL